MYDVLIRNGLIYDGSGEAPFISDIAVFGDRIAVIGRMGITRARRIIDAAGKAVFPGFIDIHTHTDLLAINDRNMGVRLSQGITTDVSGNCGIGVFPVSEGLDLAVEDVLGKPNGWAWSDYSGYRKVLLSEGIGINEAFLVSHTALRLSVMGKRASSEASDEDIEKMAGILSSLLDEGAWGFSSGLYYAPCVFAARKELLRLLEVVRDHGRIFAVHHRCEGDDVLDSLEEVLSLARETGVRLEVSHLKAIGRRNQDKVGEMLRMIEEYRAAGTDVKFDQYPYTFGSTSLFSLLPPHILALTRLEQRLALSLDNERDEIRREMVNPDGWDSIYAMAGPDDISVLYLESHPEYAGKTLTEIGEERGQLPIHALFDILSEEPGLAVMSDITQSEENLIRIMKHPLMSFGSDSLYSSPVPHPRSKHAAVHFLQHYVRDKQVLTMEEGIRRLTGENADRMGFRDRGYIREGMKADIIIADPGRISEEGDGNTGFDYVLVNGQFAVDGGRLTGIRAGEVL